MQIFVMFPIKIKEIANVTATTVYFVGFIRCLEYTINNDNSSIFVQCTLLRLNILFSFVSNAIVDNGLCMVNINLDNI